MIRSPRTARGMGRVMWMVSRENGACYSIGRTRKECGYSDAKPVLVLDISDPEKLVERVARALHGGSWTFDVGPDSSRKCYYDNARAVLRALGLPARKGGGGK